MSDKRIEEMWDEQERKTTDANIKYRPTSPTYPPPNSTRLERNRAARRAAEAAQPRQKDTRSELEKFKGYIISRDHNGDADELLEEYGTLDNMYRVLGWRNPNTQ